MDGGMHLLMFIVAGIGNLFVVLVYYSCFTSQGYMQRAQPNRYFLVKILMKL